jgi:hypothetical protein
MESFFNSIEAHKDAACWIALFIIVIIDQLKSKD